MKVNDIIVNKKRLYQCIILNMNTGPLYDMALISPYVCGGASNFAELISKEKLRKEFYLKNAF